MLLSTRLDVHVAVTIATRGDNRRILHTILVLDVDAAAACVRRND